MNYTLPDIFYFSSIGTFNHARKMKPLSMRHFILIKRRRRLNGQSSIPLLKEILNRNSGGPPGFKAAFLKQKTHFACYQIYSFPARYTNTSSLPFRRVEHEEEKQALSFALSTRYIIWLWCSCAHITADKMWIRCFIFSLCVAVL